MSRFAGELVFGSLSQLLRKEAGFSVQDQAVHTLFLLCNCEFSVLSEKPDRNHKYEIVIV